MHLSNVGLFKQTTRRCIPESFHLHTCRRENLKSHNLVIYPGHVVTDAARLLFLRTEVICETFCKCPVGKWRRWEVNIHVDRTYSGRKITESFGNVTVEGEKDGKSKGGARWPTVCLSTYSVTENIYCSQLSSVGYFRSLDLFHIV
jgi:hypothetical protein